MNAFLLDNNTTIGCEEFANFQLFAVSGGNPPADAQSHFEPPIGGFDGSFKLDMQPQKILGTTASTLKLCGKAHGGHEGKWTLVWKIWRTNGMEWDEGQRALDVGKLTNVEVAFVNNSTYKVTYRRTSDAGGEAWAVTASGASFKGDQAKGFELDVVNPQTLRIDSLTINEQTGPAAIPLARERGSCAAFRICHHGTGCDLTQIPAPCSPSPGPNPSRKGPSRL